MITIIGIGMEKGDLTQKAEKKIAQTKCVFLRSALTAAGKAAVKAYPHIMPLDDCFTAAQSFDEWGVAVCDKLLAAEHEHGDIAYLTDGDGIDGIVPLLQARTKDIEIIYGVGAYKARGCDAGGVRISASDAVRTRPYLDTVLPLYITEIDDAYLAGDLKLWLMEFYGDDTPVTVHIGGKTQTAALHEIDRLRGYGYDCELYIASQAGYNKARYCYGDLMRIMAKLTAPDGCPWDGAQTHESIRINMIEEAYEAVDAIDSGDIDAMIEEFGDVLLQAVFHCDMGVRFGEFDRADVISELCGKLYHRHTHIFGEHKAKDAGEALGYWEAAKSQEKSYVSTADKLSRLPEGFPSLLAAEKVYKKLVKAGVEKNETEMNAATANLQPDEEGYARRLFVLAAAMADAGLDAEVVLNTYIKKLKDRFAQAEAAGDVADFLRKA